MAYRDRCEKPDRDQLPAIILTLRTATVPAVIVARGPQGGRCFVEFFTANFRNPNRYKAYCRATSELFESCEQAGLLLPGPRTGATSPPRSRAQGKA
jgi:hypothetical protein